MTDRYENSMAGGAGFDLSQLVDDLKPVRPIRVAEGMALALAMMLVVGMLVYGLLGVRADIMAGRPHMMFLLRWASLLVLGLATGYAALASARPAVNPHDGRSIWKPVLALSSLFPLGAVVAFLRAPPENSVQAMDMFRPFWGLECLIVSVVGGVIVATAMILWLRRGAPGSPERTGMLVGIASGAMAGSAYSIACPMNTLLYVGTWASLAILLSSLLGRYIVPRFLAW
ncbi:MAG: DUF1109 domain-containing protein [Blastomonas sp.]